MCRFKHATLLHRYADGVKCRVFLNTLSGPAQRWFKRLPPFSIHTFKNFKAAFLHQFASSQKYQQTPLDLFALKQKPKETLREYLHRFDRVVLDVPSTPSDILISALTQGLMEGDFFRSLVKKPPGSYPQLLDRANKYIHLEGDPDSPQGRWGSCSPPGEKISSSFAETRSSLRNCSTSGSGRVVQTVDSAPLFTAGPNSTGGPPVHFCTYHQSHTHGTDECRELAQEHREPRGEQPPVPRDAPDNTAYHGDINMISGGSIDGDSHRARKAHSRSLETYGIEAGKNGPLIHFGPQDLTGISTPHDDALVIRATIANYNVARVFVGTGSLVNVLYKEAFDQT
ncbi:uncharacterized protein LOC141815900 [Curcuma longa]|uniref:uncharacterized protein LOC141815900 n=1 Tax=Curcuma longa TaxID=136217 RepID=UPI003D9EFD97